MTEEEIKILSIGENLNFDDDQTVDNKKNGGYHFAKTDYDNFHDLTAEFNVLIFELKRVSVDSVISLISKNLLQKEPLVVLVCEDNISDSDILRIPFKNKLVFKNSISFEELKENISVFLKKTASEKKIYELENRIERLQNELKKTKTDLEDANAELYFFKKEEDVTKTQLILELEELKRENDLNKLDISELTSTNAHLIAATWRERDLKQQLKDAMDAINQSKNIIEDQNRRIEQSINYAQKIQHAIHTKEIDIQSVLPQSSMYFKPKDVISGDFPWMFEKDDYVYIAAVDCTGHGVPGAMMSMIGNLLLNDLAHETGEHTPGQILDRLHTRVVKTLKQDTVHSNANDGMDIAMIRLHKKTNEVIFSSAHRPLVHINHKGETAVVKGDKFPIGGMHYEKRRIPFTDTYLKIEKNDMLFLFTDGLTDQIGGIEGKKIGTNSIFEILSSAVNIESENFRDYISNEFENWKGTNKQIDDVLLIALKY